MPPSATTILCHRGTSPASHPSLSYRCAESTSGRRCGANSRLVVAYAPHLTFLFPHLSVHIAAFAERRGSASYQQGKGDRMKRLVPLLMAAAAAQAQNAPSSNPDASMQEVIVTGSRIIQTSANSQQPLSILDRAAIDRSSISNIGDLLQQATTSGKALNTKFNSSGNFGYPPDGGGIGAGSAQVDLR